MIMKFNIRDIDTMPYTDFVGFINQWNVLPGAYVTLSKWSKFSDLNQNSRIIEIACTSGFSSRELSVMTKCSGVGIDISGPSIEMAKYNQKTYNPEIKMEYILADGYNYEPKEKFSHAVIGAALKFFPNPKLMIDKIVLSYLADGGYLLASPFYVIENIPKALVDKARKVFGIEITTENYKNVMKNYEGFEILFEDKCDITQETEEELKHYCESTVDRACELRGVDDMNVKQTMYDRLMEIKKMSNELRPYQMYSVLVLRYRSAIYPRRYTELF
jgi:Protein-L-isoaspartate carboxylmethyltransferase